MTEEQRVLLNLTKYGIGNTDHIIIPSTVNWGKILSLSLKQGVNAIVLDGLNSSFDAGNAVSMPFGEKMEMIGATQQVENVYAQHQKTLNNLSHFYSKYGIRTMVLKGLGLSNNYPIPNHRPCGDIDIYLFGDTDKADSLLNKEFGIEVDNSHHNHTVFSFQGITVENHYNFANIYAHRSSAKVDRWLKEMVKDCQQEGNIWLPSPNFNALYVLRHAASHFAAEEITIRHLLDWGFFVERNFNKVDWQWHWNICQELNMDIFLLAVNEICVQELGFDSGKFKMGSARALTGRVLSEILQPEFEQENPHSGFLYVLSRWKRWKKSNWKRKIVYPEGTLMTFGTQALSHLIKPSTLSNCFFCDFK